jgi:hypothetical protein
MKCSSVQALILYPLNSSVLCAWRKNILHHDFTFRGRLEISGAFRLQNGIPTGKINPKFLPPHSSA